MASGETLEFTIRFGDGGTLEIFDQAKAKVGEFATTAATADEAVKKLGAAMGAASDGTSELVDAANRLSVAVDKLGGESADAGKKQDTLADGVKKAADSAAKSESAFTRLAASFFSFNQIAEGVKTVFGAVSGAFGSLSEKIAEGARTSREALQAGLSTEALSKFQGLAEVAGAEAEDFLDLVRDVQERVGEASTALARGELTNGFVDAFKRLGASGEDIKKFAADTETAIDFIVEKIIEAPNDPRIAFSLKQLSSAGFEKFGPILAQLGQEGIDKTFETLQKIGAIWDTGSAQLAAKAQVNFGLIGKAFDGIGMQLLAGALPAITTLSNAFVNLVSKVNAGGGGIKSIGASIGDSVVNGVILALKALASFARAVEEKGAWEAFKAVAQSSFDAVVTLAQIAGAKIRATFYESFSLEGLPIPVINDIPGLSGLIDKLNPFAQAAKAAREEAAALSQSLEDSQGGFSVWQEGAANLAPKLEEAAHELEKVRDENVKVGEGGAPVAKLGTTYDALGNSVGEAGKKAAEAAKKQAELNEQFAEQATQLGQSLHDLEGQNAILEKYASSGGTAAEAQHELAEAAGRAAAETAKQGGATTATAIKIGALTQATQEASAATEILNQRLANNEAIKNLELQATLQEKVAAGIILQVDADRQLAVAAAGTDGILQQQAGHMFDLQQRVKTAQEAATKGFIQIGDNIKDAFTGAFDSIIAGTFNLRDTFSNLGVSIGKEFFAGFIESKLGGLDIPLQTNLFSTFSSDAGQQAGSNFFSGVVDTGKQAIGGGGGGSGGLIGWIQNLFTGGGGTIGVGGDTTTPGGGVLAPGVSVDTATGAPAAALGAGSYVSAGIQGAAIGAGIGGFVGQAFSPLPKVPAELLPFIQGGPGQTEAFRSAQARQQGAFYGGAVGGAVGAVGATAAGVGTGVAAGVGGGISGAIAGGAAVLGVASIAAFAAAIIGMIVLGLTQAKPTQGTVIRRFGEDMLSRSPTFQKLEGGSYGDFTRSFTTTHEPAASYGAGAKYGRPYPEETGSERRVRERAYAATTAGEGGGPISDKELEGYLKTVGPGAAGIFNVLFTRGGAAKEEASRGAMEMGLGMAEFFSRGFKEGLTLEEILDQAKGSIRAFAAEANVDIFDVFAQSNKFLQQWDEQQKNYQGLGDQRIPPEEREAKLAATRHEGAVILGQQQAATLEIFGEDFAPGTQVGLQAIQAMEKDGVAAYANLSQAEKEWITASIQDADKAAEVYTFLAEKGLQINIEKMKELTQAAEESALATAPALQSAFETGAPATAFMTLTEGLGDGIKQQINSTFTSQLLDKTAIGTAFQPVFQVLDKIGDYDLTKTGEGVEGGLVDFKEKLLDGITSGKENLATYLPMLKDMIAASKEIDEAIKEALKPSTAEEFYMVAEAALEKNKAATEEIASGAFQAAAAAGEGPGDRQKAARAFVQGQIDTGTGATALEAAQTMATKGPQGEALAKITTEFQLKLAAAMQNGVIDGEERADLTALKGKLDLAGQALADGMAKSADVFDDLFPQEKLKAVMVAAKAEIDNAMSGGTDSWANVLKGGGTAEEATKAFGDGFRSNVRNSIVTGMQEALMQSAIVEGALGPLMLKMKAAVTEAMKDGSIDGADQANLDAIAADINSTTEQSIKMLTPTIDALGKTASGLVTDTKEAEGHAKQTQKAYTDAGTGVQAKTKEHINALDEAASATAAGMEAVKGGVESLASAFTAEAGTSIADGVTAMQGAFTAAAGEDIGKGVEAFQGAFSASAGADIEKGVTAIKGAFSGEAATAIAAGTDALKGALGSSVTDPIKTGAEVMAKAMRPELVDPLLAGAETIKLAMAPELTDTIKKGADKLGEAMKPELADGILTGAETMAGALAKTNVDTIATGMVDFGAAIADHIDPLSQAGTDLVDAVGAIADKLAGINFGGGGGGGGGEGEPGTASGFGGLGSASSVATPRVGDGRTPGRAKPPDRPIVVVPPGWVDPTKAKPPEDAAKKESLASFSFDSIMADFSKGAFLKAEKGKGLFAAIEKNIGESVLQGCIKGFMESAAVKSVMEPMTKAVDEAMKDGILSVEESDALASLGEESAKKLRNLIVAMGPAFKKIAKEFGIDLESATEKAKPEPPTDRISSSIASAVSSGIKAGASQPDIYKSINAAIFDAAITGMIDAFMASALIKPALDKFSKTVGDTLADYVAGKVTKEAAMQTIAGAGKALSDYLASPGVKEFLSLISKTGDDLAKSLGISRETLDNATQTSAELNAQQEHIADQQEQINTQRAELETSYEEFKTRADQIAISTLGALGTSETTVFIPRKGDQALLTNVNLSPDTIAQLVAALKAGGFTITVDGDEFGRAGARADEVTGKGRRRRAAPAGA